MRASQELIQHWILNVAIEYHRKLSDFIPFVESESLNVKEVPGATPDDYASAFLMMLDAELVCAFSVEADAGEEDQATMDRSTVEAILEKRLRLPRVTNKIRVRRDQPRPLSKPSVPDLRWRITALGGGAWEKLAEPDWNRYVSTLTDDSSGEIWAADRDLLMAELGWYRELNSVVVDRATIRAMVLHNYAITYWKISPRVYHAAFSCAPDRDARPADWPRWFRDWWLSKNRWHQEPWELPDWPTDDER